MDGIFIYALLVNIATFLMYGVDKWNAKHNLRRIPEKTLLGITAAGGSLGACVGMQLFRHKIRKPRFYLGVPFMLIVHIAFLIYIYH